MMTASIGILTLLAVIAPVAWRWSPRFALPAMATVIVLLGCAFVTHLPAVASGTAQVESWTWLPELGVAMSFRLDGLSLLFALLICFIGGAVVFYASSYLREHPRLGTFAATLIGFMAAMLGLVLADNLILLFIFWELTSITSFLLIGFEHERLAARKAALQALLVTGLGGLALLAGLVLLGVSAGGFEIGRVLDAPIREHGHYAVIVVLVLLGAFTKSAMAPFHFWLPSAMEAPTPVSALLHSATMVKAGVYLVARLHPVLGGTALWDHSLVIVGGATMLAAAFLATRQTQFKRILAYSTVSSLGTMMMLIGLGAAKAAAAYLLAHAMFKGCLFLVAGSITHETGEKEPHRLAGLRTSMPLTFAAAIGGALSMAGMFPLMGFVGKELMLKAGLEHVMWAAPLTAGMVLSAVLTVMAALLAGVMPFLGRASAATPGHDPDWLQLLGPIALAVGGVVAGLAPGLFAEPLVSATAGSIEGGAPPAVKLGAVGLLWPPTTATWLSIAALLAGAGLFMGRGVYARACAPLDGVARLGPARWYEGLFAGLLRLATAQTRLLQNGSMRAYLRVTLLTALGVGVAALIRSHLTVDLASAAHWPESWLDGAMVLAIVSAAAASTMQRTALASVAVIGVVGFVIALFFALLGAPDVAMTQFAVETLVVIIFVLVIFNLPRYRNLTSRGERLVDGVIAGSVGTMMAALTLMAASRPQPETVSTYFVERSVPEAYGRNVVNVILVDFRALDTLGEVFVIGVAAVGVFTLLRLRAGSPNGTGGAS